MDTTGVSLYGLNHHSRLYIGPDTCMGFVNMTPPSYFSIFVLYLKALEGSKQADNHPLPTFCVWLGVIQFYIVWFISSGD